MFAGVMLGGSLVFSVSHPRGYIFDHMGVFAVLFSGVLAILVAGIVSSKRSGTMAQNSVPPVLYGLLVGALPFVLCFRASTWVPVFPMLEGLLLGTALTFAYEFHKNKLVTLAIGLPFLFIRIFLRHLFQHYVVASAIFIGVAVVLAAMGMPGFMIVLYVFFYSCLHGIIDGFVGHLGPHDTHYYEV